jgi:uncharacterized membrane protein YkoI
MKINRKTLVPLMMVLLIILGISGTALVAFAQDTGSNSNTTACVKDDADNVEEEVEAENEADDANETQCPEDAAEDGDTVQDPAYTGSIAVDDSVSYGSEEEEAAALASLATITPGEAQAAVEADMGGTVVSVELSNENGYLILSVTLADGTNVKVDAGNGAILHTDTANEDESKSEADEVDAVATTTTGITAKEAQSIAESETGGTTLNVEFDVENGEQIFEVELADGRDVKVSANDGTILLIEQRDAD